MRRDARHRLGRWTASGLAVVGLLATGTAGPAWADDGAGQGEPVPVAFTGPDHYDLSLDAKAPPAGEYTFEVGLKGPGGEPEPGDDGVIMPVHQGPYTVTIDASGLQGVADVRLEHEYGCEVTGPVAVCDQSELYNGQWLNMEVGVALTAADGVQAGDHGTIRISGQGDGLSFTNRSVDVLVGAPEYRMRRLHEPQGFQAGDTYAAPLAFRNVGGLDGDHATLRVYGSRGLTFPQEFSNCTYGVESPDDLIRMRHVAVCTFQGHFAAGQAYRLSTPMHVRTADFALRDNFGYSFNQETKAEALKNVQDAHQGAGPVLKLRKAASGGTYVQYSELDFPAHNTYDLDLTGDRVEGAKGETVKATVTLTNHGPAWIGALRSGGEPLGFTVDVPEGTTVADVPAGCHPKNGNRPGRVRNYLCFADTPLLENAVRSYVFGLRIDDVVKGAKARAYLPEWDNPNEADTANDDGWIVVNGTGDEQTPGDGPAGSGDGAEDGHHDTGTSDGDTDGDTGKGDGDKADDGLHTTVEEDGVLASTGSDALTLGSLAALLLAGGAAVTVGLRRRRTAAPDDAAA